MQIRSLNVYFFFFLLLAVGVVTFFIFQPFLTAIVAAAILAALFKKTYHWFERQLHGYRGLSAFLTCILVILIIITPLSIIFSLVIEEATSLFQTLNRDAGAPGRFIDSAIASIQNIPYLNVLLDDQAFNRDNIIDNIKRFSQDALGLLQAAYQSVAHFVFWVFVMFFTLFYFLIDGKRALRAFMQLSPLRNEHDKLLIEKFISISRATLKGTLVIAIIQGLLGGLAFWIAGIPSATIWGLIMVLLSIIPLIGPAVVWLPVGIIMLFLGEIWQGVFILIVGAGVISIIDNILRPKLVGRDTQMHPLLVFFSMLGGLSLFGMPGFVIGPIIVALFLALSEIYSVEFRDQLKDFNQ